MARRIGAVGHGEGGSDVKMYFESMASLVKCAIETDDGIVGVGLDELLGQYADEINANTEAIKQIHGVEFATEAEAIAGAVTDKAVSPATLHKAMDAHSEANKDLSSIVYTETSSSQTTRTITIPGVTSWDDLLNIPINIKAATYGTSSAASLNVNGLGAKSLYFPNLTADGVTTTPQYHWIRTGQVYTVVWTGTYVVVLNMQVRSATTSYSGIVQLSSSTSSTSTTLAATASAVKSAYDLANTANDLANTANTAAGEKASKSTTVNVTLSSSSWSGSSAPYTQTLTVSGLTSSGNGYLSLAQSATAAQAEAARSALIRINGQAANSLTIAADGDKPTVNIPVTVTIVG